MDIKIQAEKIHTTLLRVYGSPTWRPHLSPVGELVSTILSQNTNDTNRDIAYDQLRKEFPSCEEVRDAPEERIVKSIKTAGLGNQKGPAIQNALRVISEERGKIDLDFLRSMSSQEAMEWLVGLKGVGPKTAAIVLLFSLDMPAFPVDTHIHRLSHRLGFSSHKNPDKVSADLKKLFPEDRWIPLHLQIIFHGRSVCLARRPKCAECTLRAVCPEGQKRIASE